MNKKAEDFIKDAEEVLCVAHGEIKNMDSMVTLISMRLSIAYRDGIIEGMDRAGEIFRGTK